MAIRLKGGRARNAGAKIRARPRGTGGNGGRAPLLRSNVLAAPEMTWRALPSLAGSCAYLRNKSNWSASSNEWAAIAGDFDKALPGCRLPHGPIAMTKIRQSRTSTRSDRSLVFRNCAGCNWAFLATKEGLVT